MRKTDEEGGGVCVCARELSELIPGEKCVFAKIRS